VVFDSLGILSRCLRIRARNSKDRNYFGKLTRLFKSLKLGERFMSAHQKSLKKEHGVFKSPRR